MIRIVVVLSALLLSACSLTKYYVPTTVKALLPVGSVLYLTQPVNIPANRSYVYIAGGRVVPFKNYNTVDVYKPYCELRLKQEAAQPRQVPPGRFEITKIVEWENYYGSLGYSRFAGNVLLESRALFESDGGPSIVMYATILSLRSASYPEAKEMVCGHWDELGKVEPISLEQLKSALGDLFVIESGGR